MKVYIAINMFNSPEVELDDHDLTETGIQAFSSGLDQRLRIVAGVVEKLKDDGWDIKVLRNNVEASHPEVQTYKQAVQRLTDLGIDLDDVTDIAEWDEAGDRMDILKCSARQVIWDDVVLSAKQISDLRKALLMAVDDGEGESNDFHVEDEGKAGYRCVMLLDRPPCNTLTTWMNGEGVMAFLLATRKLHITGDHGLTDMDVDDWSEQNSFESLREDLVFSMLQPARC